MNISCLHLHLQQTLFQNCFYMFNFICFFVCLELWRFQSYDPLCFPKVFKHYRYGTSSSALCNVCQTYDIAGLTKPGKVGEILTLYQLKSASLDSKAKLCEMNKI